MVGAIAANLHEGSRSEYLAQYVFASFGTAVSVPHQEDSGIDLYCTLTERVGSRAWPRASFSVQVKSTMDPWVMDSQESVQWLVEHPLPIFLCIVDKSRVRLRFYHTSPRFYAWSMPPLPNRLELVPTLDQIGTNTQWEGGTKFSLSAPIIDATVQELLNDEFHRQVWKVLRFWIDVDLENLARIKAGIHSSKMPAGYSTNANDVSAWAIQGFGGAPDLGPAKDHVKECVAYLSSQLHRKSDLPGAVRCALLLRHFFKSDTSGQTHDVFLHKAINERTNQDNGYLFRGADLLNSMIDDKLTQGCEQEGEGSEAG